MKTHINLLPCESRRRVMRRFRLWQWSVAWSLAIVVGVALGWNGYRERLAIEEERDQNARTYEPVKVLKEELKVMRTSVDTLQEQEKMAEELVDKRPAITLLGTLGQAAKQSQGRLQIGYLRLGKSGERGMAVSLDDTSDAQVVLLRGISLDIASVTQFVDALRESSLFTQVDMKPTKESKIGTYTAFAYHVECAY